jgi:cytidyltransferase-like protein
MKIAIVSGGFDPLHVGHVELMQKARCLADALIVIVNDDDFLTRKKGKPFMPFEERKKIVENIRYVDMAVKCIDKMY